jgi:hypothetical protein
MLLNPGALQERAQDLFGFEELAGDLAGGQRVAGVVGVDLFHGFGDLADGTETINEMEQILFRFACVVSGLRCLSDRGTPPARGC